MLIQTFNISFDSTQNKLQFGTRITCTEVRGRGGGVIVIRNLILFLIVVFEGAEL